MEKKTIYTKIVISGLNVPGNNDPNGDISFSFQLNKNAATRDQAKREVHLWLENVKKRMEDCISFDHSTEYKPTPENS